MMAVLLPQRTTISSEVVLVINFPLRRKVIPSPKVRDFPVTNIVLLLVQASKVRYSKVVGVKICTRSVFVPSTTVIRTG